MRNPSNYDSLKTNGANITVINIILTDWFPILETLGDRRNGGSHHCALVFYGSKSYCWKRKNFVLENRNSVQLYIKYG